MPCPRKSASWIRPPRLSDTDPDPWSLLKTFSLSVRRLSDTDPDPCSFSKQNKSSLVGNCLRSPPAISDVDPDPWSLLKSPFDQHSSPGTYPSHKK